MEDESSIELLKLLGKGVEVPFTAAFAFSDMPLVVINRKFSEVFGYSEQEVLGKNCRFLQKSRSYAINGIYRCFEERCVGGFNLVNYTKHGSPVKNTLIIVPVLDVYFVGLQNAALLSHSAVFEHGFCLELGVEITELHIELNLLLASTLKQFNLELSDPKRAPSESLEWQCNRLQEKLISLNKCAVDELEIVPAKN